MKKGTRMLQKAIYALFGGMMALVLLLVVLFNHKVVFRAKPVFLMPQWVMLLLGAAVMSALARFFFKEQSSAALDGAGRRRVLGVFAFLLGWGAVFACQVILSYFAYFLTGWDAKLVLRNAYYMGVYANPEFVDGHYYSVYPNNSIITLIFGGIIRLFWYVVGGEPGIDRCALVLIVFQCTVNTLTGMATLCAAKRLTGSRRFARLVAVVYVALVGLSPWVMIPYSDCVGLIFPILMVDAYQRSKSGRHEWLWWLGIGLLAGAGYLVKPQIVILLIAMVLVEAVHMISGGHIGKRLMQLTAAVVIALVCIGPGFDWIIDHSMIEINEEENVGFFHYAMVGLNEDSIGTFTVEDSVYTESFPTREERKEGQMAVIRERLESMGLTGLIRHYARKTIMNYGDGSFSWGYEGDFFSMPVEDKDGVLSPVLKYLTGERQEGGQFPEMATYFQCIWLGVLLGLPMMAAACWKKKQQGEANVYEAMMLGVIGLTLFEMLFEARARYLLTYTPLYIILGLGGYRYALQLLRNRFGKEVRP